MLDREITALQKARTTLDAAVDSLLQDTALRKAGGTATFNGTRGSWRRVGGMNLFLREGDGVIMNGPEALSGQPMSNITADDFRAIPHVRELKERKGSKAVPGEDIKEVASGTNKTTLTADEARAIVTKGFGSVTVVVSAKVSRGRYEEAERKDFPTAKVGEVKAFEQAKAWARTRLRATGRNRVKVKPK